MIFFGKKRIAKKADEDYFRYRDSLTGQMNREFCFKEYERLKGNDAYSAVTVRLSGGEDMPYYEATEKITEAGGLLARIENDAFARIENGDFVLFSTEAEKVAERLSFFLNELSEEDAVYAVCVDKLDKNEDFALFLRRAQRHVGATEKGMCFKYRKIPKNT